jgi:hypothetical protein
LTCFHDENYKEVTCQEWQLAFLRILLMVLALGPHLQPPGFCFCSLIGNSVCFTSEVAGNDSPGKHLGTRKACRCCRTNDAVENSVKQACGQGANADPKTIPNSPSPCPYSILADLDALEPNCLASLPPIDFCHWKIAESLGCGPESGPEFFPLPLNRDSGRMLCLAHGILLI